jgi:hypothetical protein
MGFIVVATLPKLLDAAGASGGAQSSGRPGQARMVLAIFGGVLTFGLTALGYGLWQVITGRRSKRVIYFAIAVAGFLLLLGLAL